MACSIVPTHALKRPSRTKVRRGAASRSFCSEAVARLQLGRWLYVVGRAQEALELLAATGCTEHEAERCFLAGDTVSTAILGLAILK